MLSDKQLEDPDFFPAWQMAVKLLSEGATQMGNADQEPSDTLVDELTKFLMRAAKI